MLGLPHHQRAAPRPRRVRLQLAVLNRDSRAIFTAASKAQKAAEYLCNLAKPASG